MQCYLCSEERRLHKFGEKEICSFCKLRMQQARDKLKISSQHWVGKEIMLEKLKVDVLKMAAQLRR